MYGIDPSQVKGELQNPYYGGGGYFNDGGIASINYESGGPSMAQVAQRRFNRCKTF